MVIICFAYYQNLRSFLTLSGNFGWWIINIHVVLALDFAIDAEIFALTFALTSVALPLMVFSKISNSSRVVT